MKNEETLNDLIRINNDRVAGYEKAASQTTESELIALFKDLASQSRKLSAELSQLVRVEGKEPADGTTVSGKIYRVWMDVKDTFSSDNPKGLLAACEFGEDAAQKAYKSALEEKELSVDVRAIIESQKSTLKQAHDKIKRLRDAQPA